MYIFPWRTPWRKTSDDASRFGEIPERDGAAGIIITGDITLAGGIARAQRVLEPIAAQAWLLLAQIGNMDQAEVTDWLRDKGWNLHAAARRLFPGVTAVGLGDSPPAPFHTPSEFPETLMARWLDQALAEARRLDEVYAPASGEAARPPPVAGSCLVLVSHAPPYASACDRLSSGVPVGSTAVREFIEKHQPRICLCGHIHESRAEDRIGKTHVLNPGMLADGGYFILRMAEVQGRPAVSAELKTLP